MATLAPMPGVALNSARTRQGRIKSAPFPVAATPKRIGLSTGQDAAKREGRGDGCKAEGRAAKRRYVHTISNNLTSFYENEPKVRLFEEGTLSGYTEDGRIRAAWQKAKTVQQDLFTALEACDRHAEAKRVICCGKWYTVFQSRCFERTGGAVANAERLQDSCCEHPLCPFCARRRSLPLQQKVLKASKGKVCKFITITVENVPSIDRAYIKWLQKSFSKLRRTKVFKRWVRGGVYAVDTTFNNNPLSRSYKTWHVHLHMVVEIGWPKGFKDRAKKLPKREWVPSRWIFRLRREWKRITEGSHVIHMRSANRRWIKELCKYECKAATFTKWPEHVDEYLTAFDGPKGAKRRGAVRRIQSWGSFHGKAEPESIAEIQFKQISLWPCNCGQCISRDWTMRGQVHYLSTEMIDGEVKLKGPPIKITEKPFGTWAEYKRVSKWGEEYWTLTPQEIPAKASDELPFTGVLPAESNPNQLALLA